MKKINIIIVLCVLANYSLTQQMPQYSQYLRNQFMINPGAAGVYNFKDFTIGGRLQWVGFTNAPTTTYFSVSSPLTRGKARESYNPGLRISTGVPKNPEIKTGKFKHAIGSQLVADEYGAFRKLQFSGSYAIHIPISRNYNLSFGTKIGITNSSFIKERAIVSDVFSDNTYTNYTSNQTNRNILNLGTGLYLYSKKLFFGIAADQITRNMVTFGTGNANYDPKVYLNITGGAKFLIMNNFSITPAFLVKYMNPIMPSFETSFQLEYNEWIWLTGSYRHKDAVITMIGMNISNRFKFGYSYDYSISRFNTCSSGSHELVLGIMLGR